jgi:hypothetical protein
MPALKHTEVKTLREAWDTGRGPEIVGLHEARFIFYSVSAILRFVRAIGAARFGG